MSLQQAAPPLGLSEMSWSYSLVKLIEEANHHQAHHSCDVTSNPQLLPLNAWDSRSAVVCLAAVTKYHT